MGDNLHKCERVNGETSLNKISWTCEACEFYHVEVLIKFHVKHVYFINLHGMNLPRGP